MEIRSVDSLKNWEQNPRKITKQDFERLKRQLMMGQHSTLLSMPDGTILGGNMRLRAMKELGLTEAKCMIVDFFSEGDDGFYAVLDGEPIRTKYYETREDAMLAYALSHNDRAGSYDEEILSNIMSEHKIEWNDFAIDFHEPKSLQKQIEEIQKEEAKEADKALAYRVVVDCENNIEQREHYDKLTALGLKARMITE